MGLCAALIRKFGFSMLFWSGSRLRLLLLAIKTSVRLSPTEDQGYFYLNIQLPDAASLQRTDAFARRVEKILARLRVFSITAR